jgi:hypothetical protein
MGELENFRTGTAESFPASAGKSATAPALHKSLTIQKPARNNGIMELWNDGFMKSAIFMP